jgi:chemotaxis family two-component system response regulator PixG
MVMSAQKPFPLLSRGNFIAEKKAFFFNNLQQHQFSGQLVLADASGKQWSFYLYLGDIQYATGGIHPVRRWQRNLTANCPQSSAQQSELSGMEAESLMLC